MLSVYLLRHGETPWNAAGNKYCGRTDLPLTDKGMQQAKLAGEQLKQVSFDAVYSSPLQRAYHTAQLAGGGKEVIRDERLIEADFGKWEGKTRAQFIAEDEALWHQWMTDPANTKAGGSGETAQQMITRVDDFFTGALRKHVQANILVVAHNGINRFYLAYKLGMNLSYYRRIVQENSAVTLFTLEQDGEFSLQRLNSRF